MTNFFISIFVFAASVFVLGVLIRFGLTGAGKLDDYLSAKSGRNFTGYPWYYRLPFSISFIPEYFFLVVIGGTNYFKTNWWPLKTSGFISILIALAVLTSRSMVYQYFSFGLLSQKGFTALFTSGTLVWFLNIIVILYVALFVLVCIESVKMHGIFAPVRIFIYSLLSILMAQLVVIVLGLIVALTLLYIAYKIIVFLFFSDGKANNPNKEESAGDIMKSGIRSLKQEIVEWELSLKTQSQQSVEIKPAKISRKPGAKIKRIQAPAKKVHEGEVPRLYPD